MSFIIAPKQSASDIDISDLIQQDKNNTTNQATQENTSTTTTEQASNSLSKVGMDSWGANTQKSLLFAKLPANNPNQPYQSTLSTEKQLLQNQPSNSTTNTDNSNKAADSLFAKELAQILKVSKEKSNTIVAILPIDNNSKPISTDKLSTNDYNQALAKTMFQQVGLSDVTNTEIKNFQQKYTSITGDNFGLKTSLTELQENTANGQLKVYVSDYDYSVITVGKKDILVQRQEIREQGDKAYQAGTKYVDDAMAGYIGTQLNTPINLANGILEPVRGVGALADVEISKIPRLEIAEKSEYWQKGSRIADAEFGATAALGLFTGAQISDKLLQTRAGQVFTGVEASYNIGVGAVGRDPTERNANGQCREMGYFERAMRIAGGTLTGYGLSRSLESATPTIGQAAKPTLAEELEAVTPEGFKVTIPKELDSGVKQAEDLNILARSPEEVARAKKINDVLGINKKEQIANAGSIDRTKFREKIHESDWSTHGDKHLKAKTEEQAKQLSQSGKKPAQYLPGLNVKAMEKEAMWKAVDKGNFIKGDNKETYYFFHKFEDVIGYNEGKPTRWVRVELGNSGTPQHHSFPANLSQVKKVVPNAQE